MNTNIIDFINQNQVATICFVDNQNKPYCINAFYCFAENQATLVFKSSFGTTHDDFVKQGNPTSGTIVQDQNNLAKLKGIQFSGTIVSQEEINKRGLNQLYLKKFPISIAKPGYIWGIELNFIKFTNNTLGFGNKTVWQKEN